MDYDKFLRERKFSVARVEKDRVAAIAACDRKDDAVSARLVPRCSAAALRRLVDLSMQQ